MSRLPVLMYHGLHDGPGANGRFDAVYSVRPDDFARQLDALLDRGYHSVLLDALHDGTQLPAKPVVVSFDDGDVSNLEIAVPLLKARGMVAEFFVTSDFIDQPGMLREADVAELARQGMGVGSHGRSHAFLEDLEPGALREELETSRLRLSHICARPVDSLALPGGRGGRRERDLALALGYRHLLGSAPGPNTAPWDGRWMQRIAVTRNLSDEDLLRQVEWTGLAPRLARLRFLALRVPKRILGNAGYERLRERLL